jgi:hypothetical protein
MPAVKPESADPHQPSRATHVHLLLRCADVRLATSRSAAHFVNITLLLLLSALVVAVLVFGRYRPGRRERAMREVLDAADALEAQLRVARAEIEAVAGSGGEDPVGEAMREMLRQRLWLRDHGRDASLAQLREVRSSIDAARGRIDQQLSRIAQARAPQV